MKKQIIKIYDYIITLINHRKIINHWKTEALKDYELKMIEFKANMNAIDATFEHPLNITLIETMIKAFKNIEGAENYCLLNVHYDNELWEFTIQRKYGKTPSDIAGELRKENEELKKKLNEKEKRF